VRRRDGRAPDEFFLVPRHLLCLLLLTLLVATPAAGDVGSQKAAVDSKISQLQARIAAARAREATLSKQIAGVTTQIRALETRVGDVSNKLGVLQNDLALHQRRLDKLNELFRLQTSRFDFLRVEYAASVARLNFRLVQIYKQAEPTTVDVVLNARSLTEMLDQFDYFNAISRQDKRIAVQVGQAKELVRAAREDTRKVKVHVASEAQVIQVRAQQVVVVRDRLLASKGQLAGARKAKEHALTITQDTEKEFVAEIDALAKVSAALTAKIQSAQSSSGAYTPPAGTSSHGLIWPAAGPVTSPFGMRWGKLHPGIDIGAPYGAPIVAAAAGRVIYCGWEGGYGNLTVIDNGNGIATAYGHQSSIIVACGADVTQGQTIGYVGSTGYSTGPHLHFEVRVNGSPVDPLGYL
jgi:murein DD-endopeptidase MepM/ murein hydrolase activator NlpD